MFQSEMPQLSPRVRLHHVSSEKSELLGFAELVIGGAFVIKDIRIIRSKSDDGEKREPFVSFPQKRGKGDAENKYFGIAHPISTEAYQSAKEAILNAYEKAAEEN